MKGFFQFLNHPTDPFTVSEPLNPSIDSSELHVYIRFVDFVALPNFERDGRVFVEICSRHLFSCSS